MQSELEKIFENQQGKFDTLEPDSGHFERFRNRIETKKAKRKSTTLLFTKIAIAASISLLFGIWMGSEYTSRGL